MAPRPDSMFHNDSQRLFLSLQLTSRWSSQIDSTLDKSSSMVRLGRTQRGGVRSIPIFDWRAAIHSTGHVFFDPPHNLWLIQVVDLNCMFSLISIQPSILVGEEFWPIANYPCFIRKMALADHRGIPTRGRSQHWGSQQDVVWECWVLLQAVPLSQRLSELMMAPIEKEKCKWYKSFQIRRVVPLSHATWPAKNRLNVGQKKNTIATGTEKSMFRVQPISGEVGEYLRKKTQSRGWKTVQSSRMRL